MERIAKLEALADMADQRMVRFEDKLDQIIDRLSHIPTSAQMWGMWAVAAGLSFATLGIILAALAYLKP